MLTYQARARALDKLLAASEEFLTQGGNKERNILDNTTRIIRKLWEHQRVYDGPQFLDAFHDDIYCAPVK